MIPDFDFKYFFFAINFAKLKKWISPESVWCDFRLLWQEKKLFTLGFYVLFLCDFNH